MARPVPVGCRATTAPKVVEGPGTLVGSTVVLGEERVRVALSILRDAGKKQRSTGGYLNMDWAIASTYRVHKRVNSPGLGRASAAPQIARARK